jgi:diguanylate cyclase (GGDEF)-like protein/PAS domain S-box-containing protein
MDRLLNERVYRALIDRTMPDAMFVHTHDGQFVAVNQRACEVLGYSRTELLAMNVTAVEQDFDLPAAQTLWNTLTEDTRISAEGRHRRKDGSSFPVEIHFGLLEQDGERLYLGVVRDISERRSGERELMAANQQLLELEQEQRRTTARLLQQTETRYQGIVEAMSEGMVVQDKNGKIISANLAAETILGLTLDQMKGLTSMDPRWGAVREDGSPFPGGEHPAMVALRDARIVRNQIMGIDDPKLSTRRWISINAVPLYLQQDEMPDASLTTFADVTERKHLEDTLRKMNRYFVTLLETTSDFIYFKDQDSRIRYCSQTLAKITGHESWRDMIGKHDSEIFPRELAEIYTEEERPVFEEGRALLDRVDPYSDEYGRPGWVSTSKWPIFGDDGKTVTGLFGISRNITENKRLGDELRTMATTDLLTGVATRRAFMPRLEVEVARVKRNTDATACLLMCDVDHFKQINDLRGHAVGDAVLKEFGRMLRGEVRAVDAVGRMGGDEFAILLSGASLEGAQAFAERLRSRVATTPVMCEGQTVKVTLSIGITELATSDVGTQSVLERADQCLYSAKKAGRNRVEAAGAPEHSIETGGPLV